MTTSSCRPRLVDFTSQFTSVATRAHIPRAELQRRLLLVLYPLGTNLGIRAIVNGGDHRETEAALRRIRRMRRSSGRWPR